MSLLAPLFLLGALVIAAPIVAHLVRRPTRDRVLFSATHLLEPSSPRLDRRSRIEHPWLLLLRCLAILVLVAGFARPFLREAPQNLDTRHPSRHTVVVLDESASMRRTGLWEAALAKTRSVASELGADDRFALVVAGRTGSVLVNSTTWAAAAPADRAALLESTLGSREPGWQATHLDTAIETALDELTAMSELGRTTAGEASIVVISDFTEGARISGLAGRDWPDGVTLLLDTVPPPTTANASLHWLGWTTAPDGTRRARLRLAHDAGISRLYRLELRDASTGRSLGEPTSVTLAPHETRVVALTLPAEQISTLRADLSGDDEAFDNTVWFVVPTARTHDLPYLGGGDAGDPRQALFYISRATVGWRDPAMTVHSVDPADADLPDAPLYVVAAPLSPSATAALRTRLERGAIALVLAHNAEVVATAGLLSGEQGWTAGAANDQSDALFADIAFRHPLFAPFADPRFSDFTHVRFWQRTHLTLPDSTKATVVARFDDGSAAVTETEVGRGAVVVWAGDWQPSASQWVLSTKFVPWFQALARRAAGGPSRPAIGEVGDTAALQLEATLQATQTPGIVSINEAAGPRTIALNVPAAESRSAVIPLDAWEELGAPLTTLESISKANPASDAARLAAMKAGSLAAAQLEADQQLWRWLLLGSAAVLALESLVATRLVSRRPVAVSP